MSPEEFDNRLRSSFNDEFVPPKEHLWRNIDTRLDQQTKKPVWYWLAPLAIVAVATIAWLSNADIIGDKTDAPNTNTIAAVNNSTSAQSADAPANNQTTTTLAETNNNSTANSISESTDLPKIAKEAYESNNTPNRNSNSNAVTGKARSGKSKSTKKPKTLYSENPTAKSGSNNNGSDVNNTSTLISSSDNSANKNNTRLESEINNQSVFSKLFFIKRFKRNFSIDMLSKADLSPIKWPVLAAPGKGQHTAEDMAWGGNFEDNKWWLNFGFGNQVAFNRFNASYDSITKNKIHRDLLVHEDQLTNNGAGFQAHLNVQNKFGKGNRFSFETGINYSFRTEDIKMNELSYYVPARNNNDEILAYARDVRVLFIIGTDTTFYNGVTSFAMVKKNKYSIVTIPLRFQYEQPLNRNTFVSLGLGGGASIVKNNNTTHYDMVKESEFQKSSSTYLTASLNTMLSIYTNYNGIGQFGIYGGYQMYLTPFKVNEQYGVRMSDLQFGVLFKRPLDLK